MRIILLFIVISWNIELTVFSNDLCTAKIIDIHQDELRGSIVIETDYKLDGYLVFHGQTRYDENSGLLKTIQNLITQDLDQQCRYLLNNPKIEDKFYLNASIIQKKKATIVTLNSLRKLKNKVVEVKK